MRIVVDGVIFQRKGTGIARMWSAILAGMEKHPDLHVVLLDRGSAPSFRGIETVEFPSYKTNTTTATDSFLLDRMCQRLGADAFSSTWYTTPVSIPSVLVLCDGAPDVPGAGPGRRPAQEKQLAINFASNYACFSEHARSELELRYRGTLGRSVVTACGAEPSVFRPHDRSAVEAFKRKHELPEPYFLLVEAAPEQLAHEGELLAFLASSAAAGEKAQVLCVGDEQMVQAEALAHPPDHVFIRQVRLTDDRELACAYSGADALLLPARYEGPAVAVVEAMACGCPVVTTREGALAGTTGDAAVLVSDTQPETLQRAVSAIRSPDARSALAARGLSRSSSCNWDGMTDCLYRLFKRAHEEHGTAARREFHREWVRLRAVQAAVDPCRRSDL
jgi:glycosyltransferase involved in cell wall biosynthesis